MAFQNPKFSVRIKEVSGALTGLEEGSTVEVQPLWNHLSEELLPMFAMYRSKLDRLDVELKADSTILTEADVAIEQKIIELIRSIDPDGAIVAEEDAQSSERTEVRDHPERIWVIDPIDGTAQFVKPLEREFCSVVCLVENLVPTAAIVIAPELGFESSPIIVSSISDSNVLKFNGVDLTGPRELATWISATRSSGTPQRVLETEFSRHGYSIKTRTTSQTLDMLRTVVDLTSHTDLSLPPFALFFRESQKVWDGLAGLCLGRKIGLPSSDLEGHPRLPVPLDLMTQAAPTFGSTVMGEPAAMDLFFKYA